mmetsp:Transcript_6250/g.11117  ORF Transcript_6250/g.11117 Transcript_6250/m.11117 type:complete len:107 (+) Transcript_6250:156-476(+)|eukprot:CAMPEP_0184525038 /NCGR_PEP_ID=MMETSP0198_2-20121128/9867_1 /TAXON_ID=1112570 /ORGANISM="Thraustochytrium sp., Strain LLF1b" /LENGTH=106 /DNA_ID=CAMNT_0026916435 /DNA_START=157 /DNA_END=477 /DNA_ORIENTATION=+
MASTSSGKAYSTPEERKEEYRRYLDKAGVVDAITKVLVGLYEEPERPPKPIEFIKRYFGAPSNVDVQAIQGENQELKDENQELKRIITELSKKNQDLREKLVEYET